MKIAIVDDKRGNRNILRNKLQTSEGLEVVLSAENGKDFIDQIKNLPAHQMPDMVLMDLEMPIMDGVDAIAIGSSLFPEMRFIVLTVFDDEDRIFKAIKAGAFGYLLKEESAENIAALLLQTAENGIAPISPGIAHKILQLVQQKEMRFTKTNKTKTEHFFDLTSREIEILKLLASGMGYRDIGATLDISPNTAKKHVINIYQKLHVNSRTQALHLAYHQGLL